MTLAEALQSTLRAAVDRIIPADEYPGAWDAGVADYLTRQFENDLLPFRDDFLSGLGSLEAESQERFGRDFSSLADEEKDRVLKDVEVGNVAASWSVTPQSFFKLLTNTTTEGFYSEPEQGGNRKGLSWLMVGFETNV